MASEQSEALRDPARVAAVRRLQLLDTPPEEAFDRLTRLAGRLLNVPVALVNLIDADRQFFKSALGTDGVRERPAETCVCQHVLASRAPLVIEDARQDERFSAGPVPHTPGVVAYLGIPLLTPEGYAVGTLCVIDVVPREWTPEDLEIARDLAALTMTEIHLRISQRELVSERAHMETIFEQAPAFMATSRGPDHILEMANTHFYRVVGHRPMLGRPVAEALPELLDQGILELLDDVFRTGEPFIGHQLPMKLRRGAGGKLEERILDLVYQPLRESDGTITGLLAHGVDITEQARAQEQIAAAEAHYRRLVNNSPQTIYGQDREGRFTDMNPAGERLLGLPAEQLMGVHFREVVSPEDLPVAQDVFDRLMAGADAQLDYELRVTREDGSVRLLVITAAGIHEGDQVVGVQGIARDITAEREAEEQIRLLAAAMQSLNEGVTITRPDGQIIYANAAHARLLGYDPGSSPLPNIRELLVGKASEEELARIRAAVEVGGAWTGRVLRRRKKDGRIVPMELIVGSVDRKEAEQLIITISRDISEEIDREKHLRRTERLASLGTLVGGVAHELNNPLQAIQSFAELLVEEEREERVKDDLLTIQREAARAAQIVADLRLLARSTQDDPAPRAAVDLNDVVRHVLHTRRYALQTRNVEVLAESDPALPAVLADRGQMEQVLLNLIVNAEQAMEGSALPPRLTIRTSTVRSHEGSRVAVHIRDSGPGIESHHLDRVFDPFWTTKQPGEGTGLGLSLVHSLVMEHNGTVRVESVRGHGAEFHVEFPAMEAKGEGSSPGGVSAGGDAAQGDSDSADPARPAPAAGAAGANGSDALDPERPLRILVVDDEDAVRRVFARFLSLRGHQVDMAGEGEEALRMLEEAEEGGLFDVIVSDLRMPGLDGEALFKRLRADGRDLHRRVIFMTGDAAGDHAGRVLKALGAPVIYKPMKLQDAARLIEAHASEAA